MEKFYVLQRDLMCDFDFRLHNFEAENGEDAWGIVEEELSTNNSQEWLLDKRGFKALKEALMING